MGPEHSAGESAISRMSAARSTATPHGSAPAPAARRRARLLDTRVHPRHLALAGVLALSAVLNTFRLSQNGYANVFYSAGVKSMLRSLHNFAFASFDPGGLVTVDKPPLGLWLQAASAKVFGFSPLSLLLPEAIVGVLAVALLYRIVARRLGPAAGIASALAMAVFPSFVAVSRDNGVDPLLILLLVLACGAGLRALETGHWRTLLLCGVWVGLAFNTKTLAALLVLPGIALAYLVGAPGTVPRRLLQLLAAGAVLAVVSFSWMAFVEATPAAKRPYVGSSTNNSELGLTFGYNGFGRVGGQVGGPGRVPVRPGALVPFSASAQATIHEHQVARKGSGAEFTGASSSLLANGRSKNPIPFGGPTGPLRLFGTGLGGQAGWMIPLSLFGMLALALLVIADWLPGRRLRPRRPAPVPAETRSGAGAVATGGGDHPGRGAPGALSTGDPGGLSPGALSPDAPAPGAGTRRDPRLATLLVLGGWFLLEAAVLSLSKGIVHPYYASALAPGAGAMAGAGAVAFVALLRGRLRWWALALLVVAVLATCAAQIVLLHREHYMLWFIPLLMIGAAGALTALLLRRALAAPAMAMLFCLLAVAPAAYAATTWLAPVEGTFPAAGPRSAAGAGGVGVSRSHLATYRDVIRYVRSTGTGTRWALFTDSAPTAAPFILLGLDAGALAGYSGTDPAIDGRGLARVVAHGEARYVLLGGEFASRGGNRATAAVLRACRLISPRVWHGPAISPFGLALFDCAGHERALAAS
jgi:4-amino-4-deoxy-L-arabinose transferase-like glycosyltransferase